MFYLLYANINEALPVLIVILWLMYGLNDEETVFNIIMPPPS